MGKRFVRDTLQQRSIFWKNWTFLCSGGGTADGQSHAWNLAKLDGEYYYIDTTWGNATYSGDGMGLDSFINYNYFAVTTGELQKTHQPNDDIIVPVCQAVKDNYYVHENLLF